MAVTITLGEGITTAVIGAPTGLTGTIRARLLDPSGVVVVAPTAAAVVEDPAGSGRYRVTLPAPTSVGDWRVLVDDGTATVTGEEVVTVILAGDSDALRGRVRRLVADGRPGAGDPPFGMVRLEDLSDQIPAAATPTQRTFLVRWSQTPTQGQVSVQAVPGTLVAYVDGSPAPVTPTVDVDVNGGFTLPAPPVSRLLVTYGWQWFTDSDIAGFVDEARAWIQAPTELAVLDAQAPAVAHYAAGKALRALAIRCTLADVREGDTGSSLSKLAERYEKAAQRMEDEAWKLRQATVNPPEAHNPSASVQGVRYPRGEGYR